MRAAIYARTACVTQRLKSAIALQLEALGAHAVRMGMDLVAQFTDEGYSGLQPDRPGLVRLRDLAESRGFDVLLTADPERLARNWGQGVLMLQELEQCGVRTVFLEGRADEDRLSEGSSLRSIVAA